MLEKILIVGGGVAGLMAQNRLETQGYDVTLVEKSDALRTDGAGLLLAANVMKVFRTVGIEKNVLEKSQILDALVSCDAKGKRIGSIDLKKIYQETGYPSIAIHRHDLHHILSSNVIEDNIKLSHNLSKLTKHDDGYTVEFENGTIENYDHIIGADGIHSKVRESLFGPIDLRHTKQACWRFVIDDVKEIDTRIAYEMWGDQKRVGIIPIGNNKVYCFLVSMMQGDEKSMDARSVLELFEDFEGEWTKIKKATESNPPKMIYGELADAETITLSKDGIVLIGDAGHSTTPNLGQGAAMGIESAYFFSEYLKEHHFNDTIDLYVTKRHNKVHKIREKSMAMGKLAHISSPLLQTIRNFMMRLIPDSLTQREFEKSIFDD